MPPPALTAPASLAHAGSHPRRLGVGILLLNLSAAHRGGARAAHRAHRAPRCVLPTASTPRRRRRTPAHLRVCVPERSGTQCYYAGQAVWAPPATLLPHRPPPPRVLRAPHPTPRGAARHAGGEPQARSVKLKPFLAWYTTVREQALPRPAPRPAPRSAPHAASLDAHARRGTQPPRCPQPAGPAASRERHLRCAALPPCALTAPLLWLVEGRPPTVHPTRLPTVLFL